MQKLSDDTVVILLGSVFILIITLFIVLLLMAYKRRDYRHVIEKRKLKEDFTKQLLQSQIEVQEQTFQIIAKELHDNVGQLLSTSRMLIGLAERSLESVPDTLVSANKTIGQAIGELRSLSKSLDKDWLEQFDFIGNLKTEIERINASGAIRADLITGGRITLTRDKQIILFRIVQEAMQNAVRHSNASQLTIHMDEENEGLTINIADNGKGFDANKVITGMGLINMRHRAALLNGRIQFFSHPGKGSTVSIYISEKRDK